MNSYLQIREQKIAEENLFSLLAEKQMIFSLAKELILDQEISSIECTPEEKEQAQQNFFYQIQINPNNTEKLEKWLKQNFITKSQLEKRILKAVKLDKYKQEKWGSQLESYFLKRKRDLDKVQYSLIRTKNPGTAQELYFRIRDDGQDFALIAQQYSEGAEAKTGGLIGPVELNIPHPQIAQTLMIAQPKKVLPPTRIGEWNIILRLEKYFPALLDQNMSKRLLDELFNSWLQETLEKEVYFHHEYSNTI